MLIILLDDVGGPHRNRDLRTFNNAKAAERHERQYFEMLCNRGVTAACARLSENTAINFKNTSHSVMAELEVPGVRRQGRHCSPWRQDQFSE